MPAVDWRRCPKAGEDAGAPRVGLSRLKLVADIGIDQRASHDHRLGVNFALFIHHTLDVFVLLRAPATEDIVQVVAPAGVVRHFSQPKTLFQHLETS